MVVEILRGTLGSMLETDLCPNSLWVYYVWHFLLYSWWWKDLYYWLSCCVLGNVLNLPFSLYYLFILNPLGRYSKACSDVDVEEERWWCSCVWCLVVKLRSGPCQEGMLRKGDWCISLVLAASRSSLLLSCRVIILVLVPLVVIVSWTF